MKTAVRIALHPNPEQAERLAQLQARFAEACNLLAPIVQQTRCWNRVALHHMSYRLLRERFPDLGSQMVCNAIYSVSRASRLVYQHPKSPFNVNRIGSTALPRLAFSPQSPVFFDRHTLSLRENQASMYTLDGRMRFDLALAPDAERRFRSEKLKEIVLTGSGADYALSFHFGSAEGDTPRRAPAGAMHMPEGLAVDAATPPMPGPFIPVAPPPPARETSPS